MRAPECGTDGAHVSIDENNGERRRSGRRVYFAPPIATKKKKKKNIHRPEGRKVSDEGQIENLCKAHAHVWGHKRVRNGRLVSLKHARCSDYDHLFVKVNHYGWAVVFSRNNRSISDMHQACFPAKVQNPSFPPQWLVGFHLLTQIVSRSYGCAQISSSACAQTFTKPKTYFLSC